MCALRGRQPGGRLKSRLFCVTSFRTRVSTPCAVMRLSTVYLLLTDGFANAGVIYGQTPEKPVESRNLRLERLHLTLPKIEYPMLCWSIKMLEISLSNITTQHRIVEVAYLKNLGYTSPIFPTKNTMNGETLWPKNSNWL